MRRDRIIAALLITLAIAQAASASEIAPHRSQQAERLSNVLAQVKSHYSRLEAIRRIVRGTGLSLRGGLQEDLELIKFAVQNPAAALKLDEEGQRVFDRFVAETADRLEAMSQALDAEKAKRNGRELSAGERAKIERQYFGDLGKGQWSYENQFDAAKRHVLFPKELRDEVLVGPKPKEAKRAGVVRIENRYQAAQYFALQLRRHDGAIFKLRKGGFHAAMAEFLGPKLRFPGKLDEAIQLISDVAFKPGAIDHVSTDAEGVKSTLIEFVERLAKSNDELDGLRQIGPLDPADVRAVSDHYFPGLAYSASERRLVFSAPMPPRGPVFASVPFSYVANEEVVQRVGIRPGYLPFESLGPDHVGTYNFSKPSEGILLSYERVDPENGGAIYVLFNKDPDFALALRKTHETLHGAEAFEVVGAWKGLSTGDWDDVAVGPLSVFIEKDAIRIGDATYLLRRDP